MRISRVVLGAWLLATTAIAAQQSAGRVVWPDAPLVKLDGARVSSLSLTRPEPWLVVIIRRPCGTCDGVLAQLDRSLDVMTSDRTVVILSGMSEPEARLMVGRYPTLAHAGWYRDAEGRVVEALHESSAPVVMGLRGDTVSWTMQGTVLDPTRLSSVVGGWLRR
jgi:hypothetical protein